MSPADEKPPNADTEERSPTEIRARIDETRGELGDTVEALAAKTDFKAQGKAKVEEVKARVKEAAPETPRQAVLRAQVVVKQNPRPLVIAGVVLLLFLLWRRRRS